jgi:signal transduction histidine kinase
MSNRHSLKFQFRKQLIISVGLLVLVFSFLLYQIFIIGIGSSMHRTMRSMAMHYAQQIEADPSFTLPSEGEYSLYVGRKKLPKDVEQMFDLDDLPRFSFSVNDGKRLSKLFRPESMVFLVTHPLKNSDDLLYLLYFDDARSRPPQPTLLETVFPSSDVKERRPPPHTVKGVPPPNRPPMPPLINVPNSIFLIVILALLLVYWVSRRLINTVLNPLNELTVMAKSLDENNPELPFDVLNNKTEIGLVAKTLQQTMQRIHQFHQREKQFLQNTSHELRTPIAVVSSALDIIELRSKNGNADISDQHTNIRRANSNMAEMTNALLLLSRKDTSSTYLETVYLEQLCVTIIEEHKYLLKGKKVEVDFNSTEQAYYEMPSILCRIVISNLIRNAFEHTQIGIVNVQVSDQKVVICNSCTDTDDDFNQADHCIDGFGIGLEIVKKVVEQQQWQLTFSTIEKEGRCVSVCFS